MILKKSVAFALLFIAFHILESIIVGAAHGKAIPASFPALPDSRLQAINALGSVVSVSLVPFFAFREVSRDLGGDRLLRLLVEPRARAAVRT